MFLKSQKKKNKKKNHPLIISYHVCNKTGLEGDFS